MAAGKHFLDYCATHPDAMIRYHASDMVLRIHSDATYISEPKVKSRVGGHHFLSNNSMYETPNNGAILTIAKLLKNFMASATESEIAGIFHNAKEASVERITLEEMRHKQPPTPIQTDSKTADGILNETVK